jgi:hypothetical protein
VLVRHCATKGCPGTLPAGKGVHCPRCGGTQFLPAAALRPPRRGRRVLLIVPAILVLVAAPIIIFKSRHGLPSTGTLERPALEQAHDVAERMTMLDARDTAYAQILHRALAQHDFEYACEIGNEITQLDVKDKCLLETVEESLQAHQPAWANRAADQIVEIQERDEAFKKIMDAGSSK